MSSDMKVFSAVAVLALVLASGVHAQRLPLDELRLRDTAPTSNGIQEAADRVAAASCETRACQAIVDVALAMEIRLEGLTTTMGVTKPLPPNRDRIVGRRWRREILGHPARFGAICDTITGLTSHYQSGEGEKGDHFVAVGVIELAGRMDGKIGSCLAKVLAAFPHVPAADTAIGDARDLCIYAWKRWVACDRIVR